MQIVPKNAHLIYDPKKGLNTVDEMVIGRIVSIVGVGYALEIKDPNKRRRDDLGREFVYVPISEIIRIAKQMTNAGEIEHLRPDKGFDGEK